MNQTRNLKLLLASLITAFSFLFFDLVVDVFDNGMDEFIHLLIEALVVIGLGIQIVSLVKLVFELKGENRAFKKDLDHWREEHSKFIKGVSCTINKQFINWKLTPSQKEIGMLLLKGLNFQEIANVRNTSERTVRQQATEIYKKTKLKGRHEFAAFFLEDLLLPD